MIEENTVGIVLTPLLILQIWEGNDYNLHRATIAVDVNQ